MLNSIDSYIWVKRRGHRVSSVDRCILWDGDIYDRGLKKRRIVIYILDQEADLDQSKDLVGQHGHFDLIVAAFLSEDPGAELLPVDSVVSGEDLPRVGLHPHQRHVARLVHGFELQRGGQPDVGVQVEVQVPAQIANAYVFGLLLLDRVVPLLGRTRQHQAGQQGHQHGGPTCYVHTQACVGASLL